MCVNCAATNLRYFFNNLIEMPSAVYHQQVVQAAPVICCLSTRSLRFDTKISYSIHETFPCLFAIFDRILLKIIVNQHNRANTVIPWYSWFCYSRNIAGT